MLPLLMAGGAGLGLAKHYIADRPAYEAKRKLAAETTRWSPWTGMVGSVPDEPNAFGSVMQGGLSGASFAQGLGGMGGAGEAMSSYAPMASQSQLGMDYGMGAGNQQLANKYPWLRG